MDSCLTEDNGDDDDNRRVDRSDATCAGSALRVFDHVLNRRKRRQHRKRRLSQPCLGSREELVDLPRLRYRYSAPVPAKPSPNSTSQSSYGGSANGTSDNVCEYVFMDRNETSVELASSNSGAELVGRSHSPSAEVGCKLLGNDSSYCVENVVLEDGVSVVDVVDEDTCASYETSTISLSSPPTPIRSTVISSISPIPISPSLTTSLSRSLTASFSPSLTTSLSRSLTTSLSTSFVNSPSVAKRFQSSHLSGLNRSLTTTGTGRHQLHDLNLHRHYSPTIENLSSNS